MFQLAKNRSLHKIDEEAIFESYFGESLYLVTSKLSKVCLSARKLQTPKTVQLVLAEQISVILSLEVVVVRASAYLCWYVRCKIARDQILKVTTRQKI